MGKSLFEIAQELKDNNKTVQLIYAFNGTGKTRLSREFKELIAPKSDMETENTELASKKIIYYNAFTEDLFYWDNDLENDIAPKFKIQPNDFTHWVFVDQGQDGRIIENLQHYTDAKLTPHFNAPYTIQDDGKEKTIPAFTEVTFSYERGNDERSDNIKISKGEESCFVWSVFYSLLEQIVNVLNVPDQSDRETHQFDHLEYVFIDDPVSSLDDNHLIELAVDLAQLIKDSKSDLKFVITTHNPLFYNVLHNEFKKAAFKKYFLKKEEDGQYNLTTQTSDAPFSYHLFLKAEIEKAIQTNQIQKYHFNFLRNILEKTSTFLGYENWGELLPKIEDGKVNPYESRIINISSHSKHSTEEIADLTEYDKKVLAFLLGVIEKNHKFNHLEEKYDKL
ncbi:MAG: AAA family ATPase [Anaerovoracaceae bacterium]